MLTACVQCPLSLSRRDKKLCVHYGDRLVALLRETRQLGALGFAIPSKVRVSAEREPLVGPLPCPECCTDP